MKNFEDDLNVHFHLEDDVLFKMYQSDSKIRERRTDDVKEMGDSLSEKKTKRKSKY